MAQSSKAGNEPPKTGWVTEGEQEGKSPLSQTTAKLGLLALVFPFALLGILIATGVIDTSAGTP